MRLAPCCYRDRIARAEHEKLAGAEAIPGNVNLACYDLKRALFGIGVKRQDSSWRQRSLGE